MKYEQENIFKAVKEGTAQWIKKIKFRKYIRNMEIKAEFIQTKA